MLSVLIGGFIGYVLGGWLGVAVGACSATAVTVLLEPLTPTGDRTTAHEHRMRRNRRYRTRYEALEDGWRNPYRPRQRTDWQAVDRRIADGATIPTPPPAEIVPLPQLVDEPMAAPALAAPEPTLAVPQPAIDAAEPTPVAPKPTAKRKRSAPKQPKPTAARKPRTPRPTRAASARS